MNRAPHQREDRFLTYIGVTLLAILIAGFAWVSYTSDDSGVQTTTNFDPHQPDGANTLDASGPEPDANEGRQAQLIRFLTPDGPTAVDATLGGPGVHPAFEATSANGVVPIPLTYEGTRTPALEALVTSRDAKWAFWDFVVPADSHQLVPAGDLDVEVTHRGEPIEGASIRVSRELLSFVSLEGQTDQQGKAKFGGVPASGGYTLDIEAPGFLRRTVRATPGVNTVELERGVMLSGTVTARGAPVAEAFVVVWVRGELGFERPQDIVSTTTGGDFRAFGLPAMEARIVAYHEAFVPNASPWVSLGGTTATLDVELTRGLVVDVLVVSEAGDPVDHALVMWSDDRTSESGAKVTDEQGRARFAAVPRNAVFTARLDRFRASPQKPQETKMPREMGSAADVKLVLKSARSSGAPIRISAPDLVITAVRAEVDGAPCPVTELDRSMWQVACQGDGTIEVESRSSGEIKKAMTFGTPVEWTLPATKAYTVLAEAQIEEKRWPQVILEVLWAETWHAVEWEDTETGQARAIIRLLPGAYRARLRASGFRTTEFEWRSGTERKVSLEPEAVIQTRVTDARGELLTGSYLRLWNDGRPVGGLKRSAGQLPVSFRSPPSSSTMVVVDPRRGEAVVPVDRVGEVTQLRSAVLETRVSGRPTREELSSWLGEDLVADERGLQIDVTHRDSAAAGAGVPRGAWVVDAFADPTGRRTLVYWTRSGYQSTPL